MYDALKKEFEYYIKHQRELVKKHNGKFIVLKDNIVIGVYDNELDAVEETTKEHKLGTFLVQKCELGIENYTQTYHSRATFI